MAWIKKTLTKTAVQTRKWNRRTQEQKWKAEETMSHHSHSTTGYAPGLKLDTNKQEQCKENAFKM
jgi:hypothetical protein